MRSMRSSLREDLTAAIKAKDRIAVTALRSVLAAIENAGAVPADHPSSSVTGNEHFAGAASLGETEAVRRELTEAELRTIVEQEVHERTVAAQEFEQFGRDEHALRLRAEAEVLRRYL